MIKTKKLKYKPTYNFKLIAISSSSEDYKLSWELSQLLETDFIKTSDLQITNKNTRLSFSVFETVSKTSFPYTRLVSNKEKEGWLVPELKNIDFFLMIYDDIDEYYKTIISNIKNIDIINGVFEIEIEKLKSKEKLLF